jgi:hypothetical protein
MSSVDCTLIARPQAQAPLAHARLFWPDGRARLIIVCEMLDDGITVIARGIDPGPDRDISIAFRSELRLDQKAGLLQAIRDGREPEPLIAPASNENARSAQRRGAVTPPPGAATVDDNAIIIGDPGGDGPGPKFYKLVVTAAPDTARAAVVRR